MFIIIIKHGSANSRVGSKTAKSPPLDLTQDTRQSYFEFIYLLAISFVAFV